MTVSFKSSVNDSDGSTGESCCIFGEVGVSGAASTDLDPPASAWACGWAT